MRICDLDEKLEKLIKGGEYQVELIGEGESWSVSVSGRQWNNLLQRYVYNWLGGCTTPSFLSAYDFAAGIVFATGRCSDGYDLTA
jgi:hypothetical protein